MPDLEDLLSRLTRFRVDYVIVGGFAAVAHGVTLLTQDVNICCDFSEENLARLGTALEGLHPVHRMTPRRIALDLSAGKTKGLKNLYLDTDCGQLDCLSAIEGLGPFEEVKEQSVEIKLDAGPCRILSVEALIRAKQAMGRPKDREAILQLEAIRARSPS